MGVPGFVRTTFYTHLGGDREIIRVGVEGLGDQAIGHLRSVEACGVDQVHAESDRPPQDHLCPIRILRLSPHARSRQPHCPVPEAPHLKVSAQLEGPCGRRARPAVLHTSNIRHGLSSSSMMYSSDPTPGVCAAPRARRPSHSFSSAASASENPRKTSSEPPSPSFVSSRPSNRSASALAISG